MPLNYLLSLVVSFAVVLSVVGIIFLTFYILQGIGLSDIAKKQGEDKYWLAWIPLGGVLLLMMLIEEKVPKLLRNKMTLLFSLSLIVSIFLGFNISLVFLSIPLLILIYAFGYIARSYSKNHIIHFLLAVISIGLSIPFQLFALSHRNFVTEK